MIYIIVFFNQTDNFVRRLSNKDLSEVSYNKFDTSVSFDYLTVVYFNLTVNFVKSVIYFNPTINFERRLSDKDLSKISYYLVLHTH
jgi:hypothetical protein